MSTRKPKKRQYAHVGALFGANEFENEYPNETMRLGALTALWSLVEWTLCRVLGELMENRAKAEAAFYSTTNHKARRDMVKAIAAVSGLGPQMTGLLDMALVAVGKAADARNDLLHGLFQVDLATGELVTVRHRPATKQPHVMRKAVLDDIERAISLSRRAMDLAGAVALYLNPNDDAFLVPRDLRRTD